MQALHKILFGAGLLAVLGLGNLPAQPPVCHWQLMGAEEKLASTGSGMTASRSGNTLQTSYLHGGNMGCSDPTFQTTHTWTEPGSLLTPGQTLGFDVSAAWSLEGSPSCTSLTTGVNTSILVGTTRILAERKKIIVSKEPEGSISNAGSWVVPAGSKAGETLTITAHGDGGGVGGSVFYKYQWVCEALTAAETPEKRTTPTLSPTPATCKPLSAEAKLNQILNQYYAKISKGITDSGNKNNLLSLWDQKYDEYVCGSYQGKVLQMLSEIKFHPDPCISAWLDDWDYGPIESLWGGHQAVVIYPTGTTWTETGLVLDPWITQSPKMYSIQDWSIQFSVGSQYGVRGSSDYEKQAQYPTVGGAYAPPGELKLNTQENEFIRTLPADKQDWLKKMSPVTRKAWVMQMMRRQKQNVTVSVNSPLDIYLTDDAGHFFGVKEGRLVNELPNVSFRRFLRADGHYWTEVEYPAESRYRVVLYGTGAGQARVFSTITTPENAGQVHQYDFSVNVGNFYQTGTHEIGAPLISTEAVGASIAPKVYGAADTAWIESQPSLVEPGQKEAKNNLPSSMPMGWIVCLVGACGLAGLAAGGLGLLFFLRQRQPR